MTKKRSTKSHTTKGIKPPKHHSSGASLKIYWPYIPMILILLGGLFLNVWQPLQSSKNATLAYATEMSRSGLLSGTNTQRANNGASALGINSQLNSAAQAKANDMVARDYWSHKTPDGQDPWIFIDAQGYSYQKAGENLAYGFANSQDTIIGWMNSPSHKANLLDTVFTEVGFGFANSSNFVGTGEETVVVAMYAKPTSAPAPAPAPAPPAPTAAPTTQPQTKPSSVSAAPKASQPVPTETKPTESVEEKEIEIIEDTVVPTENQPTSTASPVIEQEPQRITLAQKLTNGNAPWIAITLSTAGFALALIWLVKHYVLVRRYIIEGEHFAAHHPVLDLVVVIILAATVYLSQSSGVVL